MFRSFFIFFLLLLVACDSSRVFESNNDLEAGWISSDTLVYNMEIPDTASRFNVILNVRNTIDFQTARLFVQYQLSDTLKVLRKRLIEQNLFDRKTGEPFGDSGLGNIFSHRILLEPGLTFPARGVYQVRLNHMMRTDTLPEILSVGIRLEKVSQ